MKALVAVANGIVVAEDKGLAVQIVTSGPVPAKAKRAVVEIAKRALREAKGALK